ncbi:mechanosensitive ion channel family protein [Guyparkeria hydrothermalis]|uniref:mechanosensitive ion channel family protein n=1 Tax=Guyparkeria TaxID=2035712 RepID=UPI0010ACB3E7|nr:MULTISPECIES: mechanosensitive ion channel domain-containing protein [Guyparkeria]MCL7751419.1 mechanosensitive ion channel family protein [Guyparkeria hydrothermalis]TKA91857.1 mechanosensitive ion channel [Guyparkeria sp. SB14A]
MDESIPSSQIFREIDAFTVVEIVAIVLATVALIVLMQRALNWLGRRLHGKRRHLTLAMVPLLRLLIGVAAIVLIVPLIIEPSLQNMIALLGALGIAIGFALKDYVSSLIAGIVAIGEKPYRNGDWVRIGEHYGEVTHVGMRTIDMMTTDDDRITIPHSRIWTDSIVNANNGEPRLQCIADFYLHPDHDAARASEILRDIALTSPYTHLDSPIRVTVREKPWGTHYKLRAYPVDGAQQFRFITDLTVRGKAQLQRAGFQFAATATIADTGMA